LINKTFAQLHAERAARRARLSDHLLMKNSKRKKLKINKSSSSQAGGPAHKESGSKRHQKNTKVFKTLQDAIIYNAKEKS